MRSLQLGCVVILIGMILSPSAVRDLLASRVGATEPPDLVTACTDDAKRICTWGQLLEAAAGRYTGINVCFHRHHAQLSGSCKVALAKYGYK